MAYPDKSPVCEGCEEKVENMAYSWQESMW